MHGQPSMAIWAGSDENSGCCEREPGLHAQLYFHTILDDVAILDPTRFRVVIIFIFINDIMMSMIAE